MKTILLGIALLTCAAPSLAQKPARAASVPAKSPLDRRIDVTTGTARLETTLRTICQIVGVSLEVRGTLPSTLISLEIRKMSAESALKSLAYLYNFGMRIETRGAKTFIVVGKELPAVSAPKKGINDDDDGGMVLMPTVDPTRMKAWMDLLANLKGGVKSLGATAMAQSLPLKIMVGDVSASEVGRKYPQIKVSINTTGMGVQLGLIEVLKQSGQSFSVEEDVPDDIFATIVIERVPLSVSLDVLCKALGVGWIAELDHDEVLIRVGRKYLVAARSVPPYLPKRK